jgi:hypothetical protein
MADNLMLREEPGEREVACGITVSSAAHTWLKDAHLASATFSLVANEPALFWHSWKHNGLQPRAEKVAGKLSHMSDKAFQILETGTHILPRFVPRVS